ncbi:unnamed protein product [Ambrosiozyma monospora]|uniref:Unnamed protein product n=1 Tax=Ambrosiozyma monospora TaxID=43982 RepID=A0A9W7DDU4_AMBMO|nr:unnamed protein product [Ambrosiozyma monospora]
MSSLTSDSLTSVTPLKQETVTIPSTVDKLKNSIDLTCSLRSRLETKVGFYRWFTDLQFDLKALGLANVAAIATEQETNLTDHHSYRLPDEKEEGYIREYIMNTVFLPDVVTNNPDIPVVQTLYQVAQMCDYVVDFPSLNEQLVSIPVRVFSKAVLLQNKCLDLLLKAKLSGMGFFDEIAVLKTIISLFPEPAKGFIFDLTDAEKASLAKFIEAYDKHLRFCPMISEAIVKLADSAVHKDQSVILKKEHTDNTNNHKLPKKKFKKNDHWKKNIKKKSHSSKKKSQKKPKKVKPNSYQALPCFNCGMHGHSIFESQCPKYADVKKELDHGVAHEDIFHKYRVACQDKHSHQKNESDEKKEEIKTA